MFTQDVPDSSASGAYYLSENYISHSDTQKGIINRLYHQVRKRTLQSKLNLVKRVTGKITGNLLDIGCGTGAFLNCIQQAGWHSTGLEPDDNARKKAASLYHIHPMPSNELFNLIPDSFDAITLWHVLEHVHQLHEYVDQSKKLLTDDGALIIAVPNYTSADARIYKSSWAAYDVPRHLYHFSPDSMKTLMHLHGMQVKEMLPMWYDSFYVSMLSEQYKNGKGNLISAFISGLRSNIKTVFNKEKCSSLIYIITKNK